MTRKRYTSRMARDIYEDPVYWLGASFFSGFLFAEWSWGILYLLSFLIAYEIFYYCYLWYKDDNTWIFQIRLGIVAGAFMGFLIGRHIIGKDNHEESIQEFCSYFGWKGKNDNNKTIDSNNKNNKINKK
jgi:hypothetical protein